MKALVILGLMQLSLTWGWHSPVSPSGLASHLGAPLWRAVLFSLTTLPLKVMVNKFDIKKKTKNTPLKR